MNTQQEALCADFEAMEKSDQADALKNEGVYIGKLKEDQQIVLLYQYQTIYIEVVYFVYRREIKEVRCFSDTGILDRYFSSENFDASAAI